MATKPNTKLETKFIATISHKLRTPLNAIMGFSDLLLDQVYGELNEKQIHYLKNINSSGKNLLTLLNDLIDLLILKRGDVELQFNEFSAPHAINDVRISLKGFADRKDISVEFENDDQLPVIRGDEAKFTKIVHHLLSNAIKYTPSGGKVVITTKYLPSPPPHLPSLPPHPHVEVSVADNGIGIKPDDQERIFSEFYQVDSALSQEFEGTGLGLSLASEIVKLHRGTMRVESDEGKGSRFTFILPTKNNYG